MVLIIAQTARFFNPSPQMLLLRRHSRSERKNTGARGEGEGAILVGKAAALLSVMRLQNNCNNFYRVIDMGKGS